MIDKKVDRAIRQLKVLIPQIEESLDYMEQKGGWLPIRDEVVETLTRNNLDSWAQFYFDEKRLKSLTALAWFDAETLGAIEDPQQFREDMLDDLAEYLESEAPFPELTPEDLVEGRQIFEEADEAERSELLKQFVIIMWAFLTQLFNTLSLMVFGKSLCALVTEAQTDSPEADKAFCKAIQIDRTLLAEPFFRKRILRAQLGDDQGFLDTLAYRLKNPILKGKIRYRTLMLTFALLEDEGLLTLPHDQLMDICEAVGVYGKQFGIEDVGHLSSRLREYRRLQAN